MYNLYVYVCVYLYVYMYVYIYIYSQMGVTANLMLLSQTNIYVCVMIVYIVV